MKNKLAVLLALISVMLVSFIVLLRNFRIDFSVIFVAIKVAVPAGIIFYFLGILLEKVLSSSRSETALFNVVKQQQFVDDLLLYPDEVLSGKSQGALDEQHNDVPLESEMLPSDKNIEK